MYGTLPWRRVPSTLSGRWQHFRAFDARRRVDVRNLYFEIFNRVRDIAEPMRRPWQIHDHVSRSDLSRQAALHANVAPDGRVGIRIGVRIAVDRRRNQRTSGDHGGGSFGHDDVLDGPGVRDGVLRPLHAATHDAWRFVFRKVDRAASSRRHQLGIEFVQAGLDVGLAHIRRWLTVRRHTLVAWLHRLGDHYSARSREATDGDQRRGPESTFLHNNAPPATQRLWNTHLKLSRGCSASKTIPDRAEMIGNACDMVNVFSEGNDGL